jgi:predicted O-methyltransferase YrrM
MLFAELGIPLLFGPIAAVSVLAMDLSRRRLTFAKGLRLPILEKLDLLPPALTASFSVFLLGTLYPHAAATGVLLIKSPTVLAAVLCLILIPIFWREGRKQVQFQRPVGLLFGEWLVFVGALYLLTIFLFPHSATKGMTPPLLFSFAWLIAGGSVVAAVVPPFLKKYEGLRILERVATDEQFTQPEYTPATPECPQPELWKMLDSQTTEVEVLDFLKTVVTTIKPKLIVETGTFLGYGTMKLAEGARENGFGKVITIEFDPAIRSRAVERFKASGFSSWIESRLESSLDSVIEGTIDLLYSDSHLANREEEIRRLLPQLDPRGLLVIHDASSHFKLVREAALRLEAEGLISTVLLSTPRGVVVAQRRDGRI